MGIYQVGLRHTILQQIAIYFEQEGKATTSSATDEKCEEADESTSDTQQQQPMVLARYELECVVCLNEKVRVSCILIVYLLLFPLRLQYYLFRVAIAAVALNARLHY